MAISSSPAWRFVSFSGTEVAFLALRAPAKGQGPMTVEVSDQEPWKSLRH